MPESIKEARLFQGEENEKSLPAVSGIYRIGFRHPSLRIPRVKL
jgi:hypothetical protein